MNRPSYYDAIVLGAGIAGLSAACSVIKKGYSCAVVDIAEPRSGPGASAAPLMMINPAAGRRAKMGWKAQEGFLTVANLLKSVQSENEALFYEASGIIRPALIPEVARNFVRSPDKYNWPEGWIEWLPKEEFSRRYPSLPNHHGGLFIKKGMTVRGESFINCFSDYLKKRGVCTEFGCQYRLSRKTDHWCINIEGGNSLESNHVIFATGSHLTQSPYWNFLPLHAVKGQTATFKLKTDPALPCSVSSLGYIAVMTDSPDEVTVGSTYEHRFEHTKPDQQGLVYLKEKLKTNLPELVNQIKSVKQWAAVRVSVKDKKPVTGKHPRHEGLFIIGALGSKGLLMGSYTAGLLVDFIFEKKPIPPEISLERF